MIKRGIVTSLLILIFLIQSAGSVFAETTHVVQAGENLFRIALRYGTTVEAVARRNNIINPNRIYVGQQLVIPDGSAAPVQQPVQEVRWHTVSRGETLYQIASFYGVPVEHIIEANHIANPNWIFVGQVLKIPVKQDGSTNTQPAATMAPVGPWPTNTPMAAAPTAVPTAVPVVPTAVPAQATAVPTVAPTAVPANNNASFGLGGQTFSFAHPTEMKDIGMTWVKFQHKWSAGESPDVIKGRIDSARAQGMKVLLSIPGARHDVIDFNAYTDFLGGVAALGPDAIEVWNEQNIDREWPVGQINAASYTNDMLKPAYEKIKAANSNVMVISGAPAPTGFFGGGCSANGCDDKPYVADMFANGAGNYMDCLGIHYNEGILSPWLRTGDPRGNSEHYTRYYPTMVEAYREASNMSKPLCFTELGYLSAQDLGGLPADAPFAWAGNTTLQQHADWLGQAVQITKNDPNIPMMIIFNIDFDQFDANGDPQAGYAVLRKDGSCPACANIKNVMVSGR